VKHFIYDKPQKARACPKNPNRENFFDPERSSEVLHYLLLSMLNERTRLRRKSTVITAFSASTQASEWNTDSGTASQMTNKRDWLKDY
jgi:hypothetical protein